MNTSSTTPPLINASIEVSFNDTTTSSTTDEVDDDVESLPSCHYPVYYIKIVTLAVAMTMMTTTIILIPCRRRLRKQHHIFPYNLVLADMSGAIVFACLEAFGAGFEPPEEVYIFLVILLASSMMVSLLSIALVTGYQFITIRIDPFGSLNIITTPRLIVTCIVTWAISFTCSSPIAYVNDDSLFIVLVSLSWATTIATGVCYVFIYRSVAKVPCGGSITQERKEQNQRILRTFGLVFGTTVLCWIFPWAIWTLQISGFENGCLINTADVMININWIANSVIYWWRLKEFRLMFACCLRQGGAVDPMSSYSTELK